VGVGCDQVETTKVLALGDCLDCLAERQYNDSTLQDTGSTDSCHFWRLSRWVEDVGVKRAKLTMLLAQKNKVLNYLGGREKQRKPSNYPGYPGRTTNLNKVIRLIKLCEWGVAGEYKMFNFIMHTLLIRVRSALAP
jgi:hypothetical protein